VPKNEKKGGKNMNKEITIGIIGVGGIGSNLACTIIPALHRGKLLEELGPIHFRLYDSDEVEESNLAHQRFGYPDIGNKKVFAVADKLSRYRSQDLSISAHTRDIRKSDDLDECDLVIVAVDSHEARQVVHDNCRYFLDLRCLGDGYISIDDTVDEKLLSELTPEQKSQSCQFDDAIETGNIQFGYLLAAAHGSQWILQSLRIISGIDTAMRPAPQSASITFGTAAKLPQVEYQPEQDEITSSISPQIHAEHELRREINSNNHGSIKIRETLAALAVAEDWKSLWDLADSMGREVSVLFDNEGSIWVDIGTAGRVALAPPLGSITPYRLWIHTHPHNAYWSKTDTDTLSAFTPILELAFVLGHDHMKISKNIGNNKEESVSRIEDSGPLNQWSEEPCEIYLTVKAV